MFPDQAYASSRGSFFRPVPPPQHDPDASPTITVSVACEWLPYIRGALYQLLLQATWDTDATGLALTQDRVWNLIDIFQECDVSILPFSCPQDFSVGNEGWSVNVNLSFAPSFFGQYNPGVGFQNLQCVRLTDGTVWGYLYILKTFGSAATLTSIDVEYDLTKGTFDTDITGTIIAQNGGSNVGQVTWSSSGLPDGVGQHQVLTLADVSTDGIQVLFAANEHASGAGSDGLVTIKNIAISGVGTPFC